MNDEEERQRHLESLVQAFVLPQSRAWLLVVMFLDGIAGSGGVVGKRFLLDRIDRTNKTVCQRLSK